MGVHTYSVRTMFHRRAGANTLCAPLNVAGNLPRWPFGMPSAVVLGAETYKTLAVLHTAHTWLSHQVGLPPHSPERKSA